jgi:hypothetical protein
LKISYSFTTNVVQRLHPDGEPCDSRLSTSGGGVHEKNSSDGGDSFDKPVWISERGATVSSHGENSPTLIVTPDVMYAAWNQSGDIRLARSLSWGASFEKPVRISDKPEKAYSGYVSIGVAPNGDVYAVWLDTRDSTPGQKVYSLYFDRSTDKGATFQKNVKIADHVCECCRPNVSFGPNNEVLVFWRHIYPGSIRDMTVAVTRDAELPSAPQFTSLRTTGSSRDAPTLASLLLAAVIEYMPRGSPKPPQPFPASV